VPHSTELHKERIATRRPGNQPGVRVVRRHHLLVRCSHWLNVPVLLGLILRLEMHPTKTKVVYCKDGKRKGKYPNVKFDFLGYCFRPRLALNSRDKSLFWSFNPAVSPSAMKAMREAIRDLNLWHQTQLTLQDIARKLNPLLRGWIEYYGRYARSALYPVFRYINLKLRAWVMRKFKRFQYHTIRASQFLQSLLRHVWISSFTGRSLGKGMFA
jgi:hypothetical protein